jgi:hypothetical protein
MRLLSVVLEAAATLLLLPVRKAVQLLETPAT